MILYILPVFWFLLIYFSLTPLEQWRIKSSFCLQRNNKFGPHLWWCSIFYKTMAGLVFCKVRHSEAIRRKHDSNHQDVAFLEGVLSPLVKKKGEAEAGAL